MPETASRPPDSSVTHEVAATLRGLMTRGELRPGMRLPSERALAARLSVSRVTVVRALARLRTEGLRHVRERMQQLELSQDELADRLKCGKSFVSQMLNGHRRPGLESLETFAVALGLAEPADLLREKKLAKSA